MSPGEAVAGSAREQLILDHLPLVDVIARRYAGRGEPLDDLVQVGSIGLVKSAHRFDPRRGIAFASYAAPTVSGEIKRHFRDKGWVIHVPRRVKDLSLRVSRRAEQLAMAYGRAPTPVEIAAAEGISVIDATEALVATRAYAPHSLHRPREDHGDGISLAETIGQQDPGFGNCELRADLEPALAALDSRERQIIVLRYRDGLVQSQIARRMGISQMHVSRLARRSLAKMRQTLEAPRSRRAEGSRRAEHRALTPAA